MKSWHASLAVETVVALNLADSPESILRAGVRMACRIAD